MKVGGRRDCIFLLLDIVPVGFLNCVGGLPEISNSGIAMMQCAAANHIVVSVADLLS